MVLFALSEAEAVHIGFRGDAHRFSMNEIPLVVGLFFSTPLDLVAAQVLGAGLAVAIQRRSPTKLVFNVSNLGLQTCLALVAFRAISGTAAPTDPIGWAGAFTGACLAFLTGDVLIGTAVRLSGREVRSDDRIRLLLIGVVIVATNTSIALIAATILWTSPPATVLLVGPIAAAFAAQRLYVNVRLARDRLDTIHRSSMTAQRFIERTEAVHALLEQARQMLKAELAEIAVFEHADAVATSVTLLGVDGEVRVGTDADLADGQVLWSQASERGAGLLITAQRSAPEIQAACDARGIRDAMVVPIHVNGDVTAVLLAANRLGDLQAFDAWDLKICETFGSSIGLSIESARVADLHRSVENLTELDRAKDDFVAMVSHELRTPLTSIQGFVQTLMRHDIALSSDEKNACLDSIDRQSGRLKRMIEDLLVVSRVEARIASPDLTEVSAPVMIEQVLGGLREALEGREVVVKLPEELPMVRTKHDEVFQITSNLIENACKHTPEGGAITVSAGFDEGGWTLTVADEGEGIPEADRPHIFDRFYRASQDGRHQASGMGLGLYICRRLAEDIGGALWLEHSGSKGTVFMLRVPDLRTEVLAEPPLAAVNEG
jgi:signal transduction histidine kinase